MKPEPGTVTCLPGGSLLKRSQVCEGQLYTEALVLSVAVFPGPKSTCQASLAWHIQQPETKRVHPSTAVCISSLGIACTEALCYSTSDVTIPLEDFAFGMVGQACSWPGKGAISWWEGQPVRVMRAQLEVLGRS